MKCKTVSCSYVMVLWTLSLFYGSAKCTSGLCEFNGIGYTTGEVVALLEETCTSIVCMAKEGDDQVSYISTKPIDSCHCKLLAERASGDLPKLKYQLTERDSFNHSTWKNGKVQLDDTRGYGNSECLFNGQSYGEHETVVSFPDRCFDLVCSKHEETLSIEASVNASCSCEDSSLGKTPTPKPTRERRGSGKKCGAYKDFASDHSMCLPPNRDCNPSERGVSDSEKKLILKLHNELREKVAKGQETLGNPGPQPSATNMKELVWNDELATVAQAWSEQCPSSHDCYRCRKIKERSYNVGQNIFWSFGSRKKEQWKSAIDYFYNEVQHVPRDLVDSFGSSSSEKTITHYTQLVWASTNEVGCGAIRNQCTHKGVSYDDCKTYVCNYGPAANVKNRPVYEKGPTASNCPEGKSRRYKGLCK
ncbi:CRISP/Allergen/PR-1-like [Palaemon carinicauda]|uniref:CRISP/Allergen/PR-1-like n=1 Tax=Palaemon carinicauda TaxID=392227 RepID=UPI0035B63275